MKGWISKIYFPLEDGEFKLLNPNPKDISWPTTLRKLLAIGCQECGQEFEEKR